MSWICPDLTARVQILKPNQDPNISGGFDFRFGNPIGAAFESGPYDQLAPIKTVWMKVRPIRGRGVSYVRGEQIEQSSTHIFEVRFLEVSTLGREFTLAFDDGFKVHEDAVSLKSNYFLFYKSNTSSVRGRLFRINDVTNNKENDEYLVIKAEEIEERGTGYGY